ncbi:hypothetical protein D3C75_1045090 [compost metagenome]
MVNDPLCNGEPTYSFNVLHGQLRVLLAQCFIIPRSGVVIFYYSAPPIVQSCIHLIHDRWVRGGMMLDKRMSHHVVVALDNPCQWVTCQVCCFHYDLVLAIFCET